MSESKERDNGTKISECLCQWQVLAVSVCGANHEKIGKSCQDANYWKVLSEGILVASVADGAGSAELGGVGASIASQIVVEVLCSQDLTAEADDSCWKLLLNRALDETLKALEMEADKQGFSIRDLATTLIVIVAFPNILAVAQVGDGAVVAEVDNGSIIQITAPQHGEYINETTFLISTDALSKAEVKIKRGTINHIAILSDGLQMLALKMPEGTPHKPFFSPLFKFASSVKDEKDAIDQLKSFLCSPRIRERADDDLTILLATFVGDTSCSCDAFQMDKSSP